MAEQDPKNVLATGTQGISESEIYDLSTVETQTQSTVSPRITIHYSGYTGNSSALGAREVQTAAAKRPLESTLPKALILVSLPGEARALQGIPTLESSPAYLELDWFDEGRRFRTNLMALLQGKMIKIPKGARMVIDIMYENHPKYGHSVRLSWGERCFVPIDEESR